MAPTSQIAAALRYCVLLLVFSATPAAPLLAASFAEGDLVRLTRSETLLFKGKNFQGAPKGQEFSVLKYEAAGSLVYVPYYKEDGSLVAVTLPAEALELSPPDAWSDMLRGVGAFRDGRFEQARQLLGRAARDPQQGALASALLTRINAVLNTANAARTGTAAGTQAFATTLQALRDAALQLTKLGHLSLALWLDEGADRLSGQLSSAPLSKLDRKDLETRVATSTRALARGRQAVALHRLIEASKLIDEGLQAEPNRSDLKALQTFVTKERADADESYEAANRMRRFANGNVHALTAIERGLKACADHPQLRALKKEMQSAFEERTSPPITPAFLAAAKVSTSAQALTEGHKLYTTRCTECHDLELLDSRTMEGWQRAVSGMSRRAGLNQTEQARILEYLAAAQIGMDAGGR
jgi:hypothetical protein